MSVPGAFPVDATVELYHTLVLSLSLSNTTTKLAKLLQPLLHVPIQPEPHSLTDFDIDQFLLSTPKEPVSTIALFCIPCYNVESPVDTLLSQLRDAVSDFRVAPDTLSGVAYAVLGVGHKDYGRDFGRQAREVDGLLARLGGRRVVACAVADTAVDPEADTTLFAQRLRGVLDHIEGDLSSIPIAPEAAEEPFDGDDEVDDDIAESIPSLSKAEIAKRKAQLKSRQRNGVSSASQDIEDMGSYVPVQADLPPEQSNEATSQVTFTPKEMVSPMMRKALTKQGYALVGSHSGVKTCRWTKASLRGRGFCYKHAFYGIESHRCMEATPSLACANKCTFCWRSHTNPVGTSWRWATDDPEFLVNGSLAAHDKLIVQLRGMPGVRDDRFKEARTPRHAALSLVGEPVMYPHIREYIRLLTEKHISTFLVTNAQFPEALLGLPPVTQLYLSIDAGTKESLKAIDRPLHRDFWERFLASIDTVRTLKARSVFRLTLVKDKNDGLDELQAYADLIRRGRPDMIEVKGVTYCGYGGSSGLTMKNSPFHDEVVRFVEDLCEELKSDYGVAAEHGHSCCVLAARKDYYDEQVGWKTWIDYDRFFELVESGKEFTGLDYAAPTPDFALYGSPEKGFSPEDVRWFRKSKAERAAGRNNE